VRAGLDVVLVQIVVGLMGDGDGDDGGATVSAVGASVVGTGGGRVIGVRLGPGLILVGAVVDSVVVLSVVVSVGEMMLVRPKAERIGFTSVGLAWV